MSISAISSERLDLLPISSHVGPLQVIVSEGHLAGVASIFVGMSGSGHGNGLRAMIPRSVWGDGSHIDCTQISLKEVEGREKRESEQAVGLSDNLNTMNYH